MLRAHLLVVGLVLLPPAAAAQPKRKPIESMTRRLPPGDATRLGDVFREVVAQVKAAAVGAGHSCVVADYDHQEVEVQDPKEAIAAPGTLFPVFRRTHLECDRKPGKWDNLRIQLSLATDPTNRGYFIRKGEPPWPKAGVVERKRERDDDQDEVDPIVRTTERRC